MNAPVETLTSSRADVEATLGKAASVARARKRRRRFLTIVTVSAAIAGGVLWWSGRSAPTTVYTTKPVEQGDLTVTVTATGSIYPTTQVEVSSELSGTVRSVLVEENGLVRKGQPLAELDTNKLQIAVTAAKAKLAAAEAAVDEANATIAEMQAELARKQTLTDRSVASSQELGSAQAAYDRALAGRQSALAQVEVAKAELLETETNLGKACICSPIDGVVLTRDVEPGQTVASSLQAPVLFTLAEDLKRMELRVDVDEADVGRLATGQTGRFTVDAYPQQNFEGTIRKIRFASETVQNVVTYKATLDVDNSALLLRPGMTATAEITVEEVTDALLVPNAALRWAPPATETTGGGGSLLSRLMPRPPRESGALPETDGRSVHVLRDGVPVLVTVEPGATDGLRTAVTGDVQPGDLVIVDSETES